mmetsp:Transcript_68631/g.161371  ORF Transcript_68631/g.161371 Transcript_68631/m.161371 type:complete len:271 (-) Transcript_68631:395-1207(-)
MSPPLRSAATQDSPTLGKRAATSFRASSVARVGGGRSPLSADALCMAATPEQNCSASHHADASRPGMGASAETEGAGILDTSAPGAMYPISASVPASSRTRPSVSSDISPTTPASVMRARRASVRSLWRSLRRRSAILSARARASSMLSHGGKMSMSRLSESAATASGLQARSDGRHCCKNSCASSGLLARSTRPMQHSSALQRARWRLLESRRPNPTSSLTLLNEPFLKALRTYSGVSRRFSLSRRCAAVQRPRRCVKCAVASASSKMR